LHKIDLSGNISTDYAFGGDNTINRDLNGASVTNHGIEGVFTTNTDLDGSTK